ncbi:MAG TPA: hypothetical protein VIJ27_06060 [Mucilaginibacter sp.]
MEIDNKKVFIIMGIFALFLVSMVVSQYYNAARKAGLQKVRKAEFGKLQFKGTVINHKVYRYMNKNYYQVCVKLDSANMKELTIFNEDDCVKIKDGIAAFSAGYLNNILGPVDSVAVNINNSGQIIYHYKGNARDEHPLGFDPMA